MKIIATLITLLFGTTAGHAQNIGIGNNTPHPSALLDITSTTKGLLPPRMTSAQRNTIAAPAKGMLVYDTDANALYHHNGSGWAVVNGPNLPFTLPYAGSISMLIGSVFDITNTGDGKAITATKTGAFNAAVEGRAEGQFGIGAEGRQTGATGFGVYGANPTGFAVVGISSGSGAAMEAVANKQLDQALLTHGNLRFYGGSTTPTAGAVLTTNGTEGFAVWESRPKVAFRLEGVHFDQRLYYSGGTGQVVRFKTEDYDLNGNVVPTPESGETGFQIENVFTAPVDGIYAFDYGLGIATSVSSKFESALLSLISDPINGNEFVIDQSQFINRTDNGQWPTANKLWLQGSTQVRLNRFDKVFLRFLPDFVGEPNGSSCAARYLEDINYFSGRLLVRL